MLRPLALLLPALIPSWRFFDVIAPSPRIEFAMLTSPDSAAVWQAFRPRPARVALSTMLGRLFWNPRWNESLFLVSCAERLVDQDPVEAGKLAAIALSRFTVMEIDDGAERAKVLLSRV